MKSIIILSIIFFNSLGSFSQILSFDFNKIYREVKLIDTTEPLEGVELEMKDSFIVTLDTVKIILISTIFPNDSSSTLLLCRTNNYFFSISGTFKTSKRKNEIVNQNEKLIYCKVGGKLRFRLWDLDSSELNPDGILIFEN